MGKNNKDKNSPSIPNVKGDPAVVVVGKKKGLGLNNNKNTVTVTIKKSSSVLYSILVAIIAIGVYLYQSQIYDNKKINSSPPDTTTTILKKKFEQEEEQPLPVLVPRKSGIKDSDCRNRHSDKECKSFAERGECEISPGWMWVFCPKSCNACSLQDPKKRCVPEVMGMKSPLRPAWKNGDVKPFFEGLQKRFPEYDVEYLYKGESYVVVFHNFLSDKEIKALISLTAKGMRRSTDQGEFNEAGIQEQVVSTGRTSSNSWCDDNCDNNPIIRGVTDRIENVTMIPKGYYEAFQVLRYEIGQEYKVHHDMGDDDNEQLPGPRILTFFLYLSDVEEGGGTSFPKMGLTKMPKRGDAILWPSVTNDDVTKQDPLTFHAALPVQKGVKYAANHWIHLYNYKIPNKFGCSGSFD